MTFDEDTVDNVWNKAREIPDKNPEITRQDACGTSMNRDDYGNRDSKQGWEIDHKDPKNGDSFSNLQPLQWENNLNKSNGKLKCSCNNED
jgi:hypothetical protein